MSSAVVEGVPALAALGFTAFTTQRDAGDFGLGDGAAPPPPANVDRWHGLAAALGGRLASARQVHGTDVLVHAGDWDGWRRHEGADGHVAAATVATAMAVTIADCIPVFLAHPSGAAALLHAGWRGVAGGILGEGVRRLAALDAPSDELTCHLGPGICGRYYEVGPEVYERLTGYATRRARQVDLRFLLAEQAKQFGITRLSASGSCTRCDNARFFSHRAGDAGRQVAVLARGAFVFERS